MPRKKVNKQNARLPSNRALVLLFVSIALFTHVSISLHEHSQLAYWVSHTKPIFSRFKVKSVKSFYHHATQETIKPSAVKQNKNITILSFATDPKHCMLKLLTDSSPYPVEILGKNKKWQSHRDKLEAVKRYLSKKNLRNSDKIIMFVDGYDTFFAPGNQDIIKKFHTFHKPIVISAEIGCWPFHTPACIDKTLYPKSPTPFQYVNSGTYIGYASAIYKMLKEVLHDHPQQRDDQYMLHDYFINHPDHVALDYHQEIFSLLYETRLNNYHYDDQTGFISNLITHSTPVVFHGNGPFPVKQLLLQLHARAYKSAGSCDNH